MNPPQILMNDLRSVGIERTPDECEAALDVALSKLITDLGDFCKKRVINTDGSPDCKDAAPWLNTLT